ncbi:MAG: outer membrane beta-barrel protein [Alphaproteobacteria bacterium]|nr:outer membrane beta-barrel protein [Alphaproteobacteria bacterium]
MKTCLLGAAAAVVLTGAANAGYDRDGWYVGLEGAFVSVEDTAVTPTASAGRRAVDLDNGWGVLGTAGYALTDSNWRIEGEFGYRFNDGPAVVTSCAGLIAPVCTSNTPELTEWSYMVNAVYDFKFSSERFGFSVGAGIGMDNPRLEFVGTSLKDSNWQFAAQGIIGTTYRLTQNWDLTANYRYMYIEDAELFRTNDVELRKHNFSIGLRYGYNEPPAPVVEPPPPPPPPPPAPKQFIVFFGFNKCNITAEADSVLAEAAAAAKTTGAAAIRVVGHTDTSGSNAYNQKLSECRADAVKTNLVGKGIAEGSISTSGKGEAELMVQTGDGVKEPQNRRATVDLN